MNSFVDLLVALVVDSLEEVGFQFPLKLKCADQMIVLVLVIAMDCVFVLFL
jgi:hypothetical protein